MTLQQLQYFVAACRHGNISYAAREFDVSQPSVSIAIRNLEREFGVSLIQRQSHGFSLTEAGNDFLSLAASLLEHTDQISRIMRERGKGRHLIRLGMPPMAAMSDTARASALRPIRSGFVSGVKWRPSTTTSVLSSVSHSSLRNTTAQSSPGPIIRDVFTGWFESRRRRIAFSPSSESDVMVITW